MTSTTSIPLTGLNGSIKIPNYSDSMLECATKATRKQFPDPSYTGFVGEIDQATKAARSLAATREIFEHMTPENLIEPSKYEVDGIVDTMYVVNAHQPADEITFNVLAPGGSKPVATYVRVDNLPPEVLAMVRVFSETKKKADTAVMDSILLDTAVSQLKKEKSSLESTGVCDGVALKEQESIDRNYTVMTSKDGTPVVINNDVSNVVNRPRLRVEENNGHIDIVPVGPEKEFVAFKARNFETVTLTVDLNPIKNFDIDAGLARIAEITQENEAKLKTEWDDREGPIFLDPSAVGEK